MAVTMQTRADAGAMAGRLPWPVSVYLFCTVVPIWFNAGPLLMSTQRLFLVVMILPIILRLLAGQYGRVLPTDVLFLAHVGWFALALAVKSPQQMITQTGSVGVEFLGGYALARAYVRTPETFLTLCRTLILIVLCLVPFALHEALTGHPLIIEWLRALPGIGSVEIVTIEKRLGLERVQGIFAHPIHFGLFCSVIFSLAFVALKGVTSEARRWTTAAIVAGVGFLGLSSGAWLAIILQILLIAWAAIFARIAWRWWLLVGLFALTWVVIDLLSSRTPLRVFMTYATFSSHNAYWRGTIFEWGLANVLGSAEKGIAPSPLFGIGMNDWVRPWYMYSGSMDNFWLVVTVRYGVPAFLFLALGYGLAIARIMRREFEADSVLARIRRAWVFTFLGLTFTLCTVHVWGSVMSFTFFVFGAGMWLITAQESASASDAVSKPPSRGFRYSRFPQAHQRTSS